MMKLMGKSLSMACWLLFAATSQADYSRLYEVTITNVTKTQSFTPQLLAAHTRSVHIFELGSAASQGLDN